MILECADPGFVLFYESMFYGRRTSTNGNQWVANNRVFMMSLCREIGNATIVLWLCGWVRIHIENSVKLVANPRTMQHLRRVASWTSKSRKTDWANTHDDPKCMSTEETTPGSRVTFSGPRVTFSLSSFRSSSSRRRRESQLFGGLLCVSYHSSTWLTLMVVFLNVLFLSFFHMANPHSHLS